MAVVGTSEVSNWKIVAWLTIFGSVLAILWALTAGSGCKAQAFEAVRALELLHKREVAYRARNGEFTPMAPCTFSTEGARCFSRLAFTMSGDSSFSYRVELTDTGFVATAVGVTPEQYGAIYTITEAGVVDDSGAVCGD